MKYIPLFLLFFTGCFFTPKPLPPFIGPMPTISPTTTASPVARAVGFTLDDVSDTKPIVAVLKQLKFKPWVRVVFDEGVPAKDYIAAVAAIRPYAFVIGELLDSDGVANCSQSCYEARARDYARVFSGKIDVIEGCNEINGSGWLGSGTIEKCSAAIRIIKAAGIATMLTLYSEEGDTYATWAQKLPADIPPMVDFITLSEYPGDNIVNNKPYVTNIEEFAQRMGVKFVNAKIGYGECGPSQEHEYENMNANQRLKIATTYWTKVVKHPRWVGLGLYWYGAQEISKNPTIFVQSLNSAAL